MILVSIKSREDKHCLTLVARNNAMAWRGPDDLIEIHFHTSCIENCRTNDMLAYVAAHEISHVLLRHGELQAHLPKICQEAEDLRMKHEHEADYLGLMLMATAGFDPKGALKWHIFMKERHDRYDRIHKKTILPGKGTHPPVSRISGILAMHILRGS
jgi:predicted Zn-dependent protease